VTQQHQDDQNDQDQTQAAAREITPLATVRPAWECSQQHQKNDNNQNGGEHIAPPFNERSQSYSGRQTSLLRLRILKVLQVRLLSLEERAHVTKLRIKLSVQKRSRQIAFWTIEDLQDCSYAIPPTDTYINSPLRKPLRET
jgi:hypothetical protein